MEHKNSTHLKSDQPIEHLLATQAFISAPDGFTIRVMRKLNELPAPRRALPPVYQQWGASFVAAGLLLLLLNNVPIIASITPFSQNVNMHTHRAILDLDTFSLETINMQLSDGFYYFTDLLTKPLRSLSNL